MVTKASKKTTVKRTTKPAPVAKKTAVKKRTTRSAAPTKVDYYPNRMTVAVSALAGTVLVLLAVITVLGSRS